MTAPDRPMHNPFDLSGKVAMVTGANTGIGQAIAVGLAQAGADIVLVGRTEPVDTLAAVRSCGRRVLSVEADLSTIAPVSRIVGEAVEGLGRLDVLVNNAGIIRRNDLAVFTEEDWDAVVDTNLKSLFFLSQAAAQRFVAQRSGKIVNIASLLSFQGGIRVPSYAAAKSGVAGVTRALANELAPSNIQVNAVAPGYIVTNNTAALRADATRNRQILERIPAGRWGEPRDIAGAVVFLASAAADYVTGQILAVDGGWLSR